MPLNSRIANFYNLSIEERIDKLASILNLSDDDVRTLQGESVSDEILGYMIENVVGRVSLPLGIATNFIVNGKDYLIPMAVEESSIVAAASNLAKIARAKGGFTADYSGSFAIGQIQVLNVQNIEKATENILSAKDELSALANSTNKILVDLGGGAVDIEVREIKGDLADYLIIHLIVNVKDVQGANTVNTMLEKIYPKIEELTQGEVLLKIISNYAVKRTVKATAVFDKELLGGEEVVDKILLAYDFANNDIFRCTTHNKGIMNGITAVLLATGNDTRAVEAGAHAFATRNGGYKSLTSYEKNSDGDLVGTLEVPTFVGILGGAINVSPIYKLAFKIMSVTNVGEFAEILGAVGLAQNLAALRALVSEGIQAGHMSLHARNIAIIAGAEGDQIEEVARKMIKEKDISVDKAKEILSG
ncbi:MAG: hydroxymethylglutaryl-CoA reductase, degradative [Candidatus Heimdallarchaeaceae archaeon]